MKKILFFSVAGLFILTGLYCGEGISAEIKSIAAPVEDSFPINYGFSIYGLFVDNYQTGVSCRGSDKVTLTAYYRNNNTFTVPCNGSTTWSGYEPTVGAVYHVNVIVKNHDTNPAAVTIQYGRHGSASPWPSFGRNIPGRSECGVNYEPTVKISDMTPGYKPSPVRILSAGTGNGQISLKPMKTDSNGSFISNSGGKKIYMNVWSSGAENWNNAKQVWEGPNNRDYHLHLKAPARDSEGVYEGTMQVSLTCL